ncbi:hypothetical protein [Sphingomonas sp.]|jgi:hypothetical protein|uniref:hypothetical protein n=1 Tax=Sphingomonas sp. TaxID=28214 RepID=UPI002E381F0E|nr:hypothetical protein [Sphingomonas sp.]HEX4695106.1 hypothetical protein [Sphingomonas sp.]
MIATILFLWPNLGTAKPTNTPCPVDRVIYHLEGATQFTMGFVKTREPSSFSDLVLFLRTPRHTYWFSPAVPNGAGNIYLQPDVDPRLSEKAAERAADRARAADIGGSDREIIGLYMFKGNLSSLNFVPSSRDPAPAYLFAPELIPALWYDQTYLAYGDPRAPREVMPLGLFKATGCQR